MKPKMLGYYSQLMLFLLAITARFCTGFDFECNFDSDVCGFQQVRSWGNTGLNADHKDWSRAKSSEPVRYSGPSRDHTSGSANKDGSHYGNIAIDDIVVAEYWKPNVTSLTAINSSVCLNNNVELECAANGYPPSEYSFYLNDVFVRKSFNGRQNIRTTAEGNATYRCLPTNVDGTGENATIAITTNPLPTVLLPPLAVVQGSTLNLICNASGNMPFEYVWKLGSSPNINLPPSLSNNYTKPGIKRGDNRYFRCFVTDKNGCSRESSPVTRIDIQYPPYYASLTATKPAVCLNNMASLRCYAAGNPSMVTLVLYSGGQVLASSTVNYVATLLFNSTRAGTHTYVCKTNNSAGIGVNASRTMITQAPPQITGITVNQTIAEGSRLVLECNTSGSDPMTVTWKKVGGSAFPSGRNVTFESLTTADQGAYECTASNGNECPVSKSQTYVHVLYKPRRTSITVSNSTVCLNDLVQLECTTEADPPATHYHFYVNDQLIKSSSSFRIQMNSTTEGNNTYRCQPGNTVGLGENATVFMNTKAPPNITWLPPNQSIAEGSTVLFPCNVTGSDPMKIVWKNVRVNSLYPVGHHLKFQSLMRSHDGVYECSASNGIECPSVSSSTYINVLYQPEITQSPKSTLTLYENGTINLNCKAHGNPAPNITWTRSSDVVGRGDILVLKKEQSSQGVYVCTASNGVGVNARANSNVVVKICENFCQQNNTCIRQGSTQSCDCRKGLTGRYCEKDDPMGKKFSIRVVLVSPAWKDQYSDSSSNDFKNLEKEICFQIKKLFFRTLISCKLTKASKGSVITETDLEFNETKTQSEVEGGLYKASANNKLGSLKFNASAAFQASVKDNMCESKPCLFDGKCIAQGDGYKCECKLFRYGAHCENGLGLAAGIIIIIVVILIVAVIIFVIAHFCCLSNKNKGYTTDSSVKEKEFRMDSYKIKNNNQVLPAVNHGYDDKQDQDYGSNEKPIVA